MSSRCRCSTWRDSRSASCTNVAKAYVGQLGKSRPYPELNDVIGITICDFELWPAREGFQAPMLSRWRMQEQHGGSQGLSQIQFAFLELPKYDTTRPPADRGRKVGLLLPRS